MARPVAHLMTDAPVIVIGAGHNGLTAAFYLARAGFKTLVLERRPTVGGAAITGEIAPGFRGPTLAHCVGPLRPAVLRDMKLARGVEFVAPDPRLICLSRDGRPLPLSTDVARTATAIRSWSESDATAYTEFAATLARLGGFLSELLDATPPSLDGPAPGELWDLLKTGRRFRALGRADGFRLLRWMPMAAADLVAEHFTTELLQAAIASRGIIGVSQGPRSAGTGAALLMNAAHDPAPGGSSIGVKGGLGVLTAAMADAARKAGVEIRTGAAVSQVLVRNGRAAGVILADGSEIAARAVVSNGDPRHTLLGLVSPIDLDPDFLTKVRNYRSRGTSAKINLALAGLPTFRGVASPADLRGRIQIGASLNDIERAFDASKYGEIPEAPFLDITIPTLHDSSLAPAGAHVMSIHVQYVPFTLAHGRHWSDAGGELVESVLRTLGDYAPDLRASIVAQQVITPADLQATYGLSGGHPYHGEPSLDQLFTMRPILGWAQYRTPVPYLYLCGAGTHPGGGVTGGSGHNAAREIVKDLRRLRP